jgi:hypothetical protein
VDAENIVAAKREFVDSNLGWLDMELIHVLPHGLQEMPLAVIGVD